jgi:hypothetical protein
MALGADVFTLDFCTVDQFLHRSDGLAFAFMVSISIMDWPCASVQKFNGKKESGVAYSFQ